MPDAVNGDRGAELRPTRPFLIDSFAVNHQQQSFHQLDVGLKRNKSMQFNICTEATMLGRHARQANSLCFRPPGAHSSPGSILSLDPPLKLPNVRRIFEDF